MDSQEKIALEAVEEELEEALLALDELASEEPQEALDMFNKLPDTVQAQPAFQISLSQIHHLLGQRQVTIELLNTLLEQGDQLTLRDAEEAHRLLGDALEDEGELNTATEHFLKSAQLSKARFEEEGYDLATSLERCRTVSLAALTQFQQDEESDPETVEISVVEAPTEEEVRQGLDPQVSYQVLSRADRAKYSREFSQGRISGSGSEDLLLVVYARNLVLEFDFEGEFLEELEDILVDALDSHASTTE